MALYRHPIEFLCEVVPAGITSATSIERRLSMAWSWEDGGCLHSRWTHARD